MIKSITIFVLSFFTLQIINAQVSASFNANQTSGCPNPFLLILNNTSTGGPFTSFNWQLTGPTGFTTQTSNTNQLSTTLNIPGFYSVSLTVCNGANCDTETINNYIEVFSNPTITMNIAPLVGCPPLEVCFDGIFNPECGTIASSVIDVRDGTVYNNVEDVCHIYTNAGNYTNFTVSVTNSCGCVTTENFNEVVAVSPPPVAEFTADVTFSCTSPLTVNFTNNSTNTVAGTIYEWNIPGLVNSANTQNLTQSFNVGTYDVELIVTNPNGCSDTIIKPNYIIVGNPIAGFTSNRTTTCIGSSVNFFDNSSGNPLTWLWTFEGHGTANVRNPGRVFNAVGTWDVTLEVTYAGGCTDRITMTDYITVEALPVNSFTVSDSSSCSFPFTTTFTSTSTNANTTTWTFPGGTPNTFTGNGPVNVTYNANGNRNVVMTSTSSNGCSRTTTFNNVISIIPLNLQIRIDSSQSCIPANAAFSYLLTPNETVANQTWTLPGSDIGTSTMANPHAVYNTPGCYDVTLTVNTTNGCTVTRTRNNFICAGNVPTSSFTVSPTSICFEEEPICVTYTGTGADTIFWNFGDSAPSVWGADEATICHNYSDEPGDFSITMIPYQFGCPGDTLIYTDTVHVLDPVAAFTANFVSCTNWNTFNFTDQSVNADSVFYTFGDLSTNSDTSSLRNPQWIYPADDTIRTYTLTQFTYNFTTGCEHEVNHTINVYPPHADFTINDSVGCAPFTFSVSNTSLNVGPNTYDTRWNWVNTNQFSGGGNGSIWGGFRNTSHTYNNIGEYTVAMINKDPRGCRDTVYKDNLVTVHGVNSGFTQDFTEGCVPLTVNFTDNSNAPLSYIDSWFWNFGDGNTLADTSILQNPNYTFTEAGVYTISLTTVDSFGCTGTSTRTITVQQPFAKFSISDTFICNNQSIAIVDSSDGNALSYNWQFSNATPMADNTPTPPSITFNTEGNQTLLLEVTDSLGCTDDTTVTLPVFDVIAQASANIDTIPCFADVMPVNFTNTSFNNVDSSSVLWNLGNGVTSTSFNPSAIYQLAGQYVVSLSVASHTGCIDTSIIDTIYVGGPYAEIEVINRDSACICDTIDFAITTWNAVDPAFISGDGGIIQYTPNGMIGDTIIDTISYAYCQLGSFNPQVFINDGTCSGNVVLNDTIFINNLISDFDVNNINFCDSGTVCFTDLSENQIAGNTNTFIWNWDFGDGSTSTDQNPCHQYSGSGIFDVQLIIQNGFGCIDSITKQIYIPISPNVSFSASSLDTCLGTGIDFWDSTMIQVNSQILTWHWDFGDNSILTDTANTQNTDYLYNNAGQYWVSLMVVDTFGCSANDSLQIEIFALPNVNVGLDQVVCFGDSAQLQASGANTYFWSPNYQISDVTIDNPFVDPLIDTSYFLQGIDNNGCINRDTIFIDVNNINVNFGSTTVCLGNATMFFDSSNTDGTLTNWTWDFDEPISGANNMSNLQNPSHTYATPGTYNVSLNIQDDNTCSADTIISTLVVASPMASFTADSVCHGLPNTFNSTASNGGGANIVSYFWDFGDVNTLADTSILQNPTFTYTNPGLYTVSLTITTDQMCAGNNDDTTFVVEVFALPSVNAGLDQVVCFGDSVQLQANGADSYFWSPNQQITDVNISNPIVFPSANTSYIVQGTNMDLCVNQDTVDLQVNTLTANFGAPNICLGEAMNFSDSSSSSAGVAAWTWNFDEPTSGINNTSNIQNPSHTYLSEDNFNVNLSVEDIDGCTADTIIQVSVSLPPMASFTAGSVCFGTANTFNSATSNGNGANIIKHHWNFGQNATDTSILANPAFTYANPGLYTVCLTITTDQICTQNFDDTCFIVQVYGLPNVNFDSDSSCLGVENSFIDLSTPSPDGNITYTKWNFGQNAADTASSTTASPFDMQFTYTNSGNYLVTLEVEDENRCQNQASKQITVFEKPIADFNSITSCMNVENEFFSTSTNPADGIHSINNYFWNFDEGAGFVNGDSLQTYLFNNTGTHDVSLVVIDEFMCTDTTMQTLNILSAPEAIIAGDTTICPGISTTLSAATSIVESPPAVFSWNVSPNQTSNITYLPNTSTIVTVIVTDARGCRDTTSIFVEVLNEPEADFTFNPACEDLPINVNSTSVEGSTPIVNYSWNISSNNSGNAIFLGDQFTYTVTTIDTLNVKLVVTDANNCTDSISQEILVDQQANLDLFVTEAFICNGQSFVVNVNDSNQVIQSNVGELTWSPITNVVQEDSFIVFSPTISTTYTLIGNSVLGNCPPDDNNEIVITVAPLPILTIEATPNRVVAGGISYIDANVVPFNMNTDSLIWTNVDGTLNTTFGFEIEATPNQQTTYPAQYIYYVDTLRCAIDTSITIFVIDVCTEDLVYAPNIFTPNNDGKNDVFKLSGYSIQSFNYFRVFDRWGQLMYEGTNIDVSNGIMSEGWLGDNKGGRDCTSGVYVYTYELICSNGDAVKGSGNVTLIK